MMSKKLMKHCESLYACAMAVFLLGAMVFPPHADAQRGGRPNGPAFDHHNGHRGLYPRPGFRIPVLPREYRILHFGPLTYFFLEGVFYRPAPSGYVVVPAPVGARVVSLPDGAVYETKGDISCYTYAGVYYQKVSDGYMVIATPDTSPSKPEAAIAQEEDQIRVTAEVLNVRSGPGKEHSVIGQVHENDLLVVRSWDAGWYYVQLPDSSFGWVMADYTALVHPKAMG